MNKKQYIEYLIATQCNYTCANLADHLEGDQSVSHDAVADYLRREKLTPRGLWEAVAPLIDDGPNSYLIVDDSVQDKRYSRKIELVRLQYSGAVPGLVRGIGVINLMHTNGEASDFYPVDYRLYDPDGDGKGKNEHFREMLIRAKSDKRIQARTILFDSWYSSVENLKLIHRMDLFFFTTLKSNRLVSLSKETGYQHLQDIAWSTEQLKYGILVKLKELSFLVRLFKIASQNGDIEWLITNREVFPSDKDHSQRPITAGDVQNENAVRWQIEQMHRELKQLVGTEKCQCRKARSQRNHIACCYLAWLAIKVQAKKIETTLYRAKANLLRDYLRQQLRNPTIRAYATA